jgi:hypothetical protein
VPQRRDICRRDVRHALSTMKMNAQYTAASGRDYRCVRPKGTENRKMWVRLIICDGRDSGLFWTAFEDLRRDEANYLF